MAAGVVLRDDSWHVRVLPERGGGLAECTFRGQPILAPVRQQDSWPEAELSYFPLVPFSNRIANSRFSFEGRVIRLEPNVPGYAHALHGQGWQSEWHVVDATASECTVAFEHAASDRWPWDYRATQTFKLDANALHVKLALRNLAAARMPGGLGFHPFFGGAESALLTAAAACVWTGNAAEFPRDAGNVPPALDFGCARAVRHARGVDRCYSGWRRNAAIEWPDAAYRVSLFGDEALAHFMLYVPRDRDFFSIEPVSHVVDAVNFPRGDPNGARVLDAGEEFSAAIALRVD
jgi:aldose 1-epimerase